jgi:GTPase-associated protein 1
MHGVHRLRYEWHRKDSGELTLDPLPRGPGVPPELPGELKPLITVAGPVRGGSFSYARLPKGRAVVCQATAGRTVEVIHLPGGAADLGEMWPIDLWESPSWAEGGGGAEAEPPPPGAAFNKELLVEFARGQRERVAPFLADVRRLFARPAGRQIVVAEREPGIVAHWIALACDSLDGDHARALTFTTGTHLPYDAPQHIIGIGPDADFDHDDADTVRHLYRVHDGLGGAGSPPRRDPWAERAAACWLAGERPPPFVPPGAEPPAPATRKRAPAPPAQRIPPPPRHSPATPAPDSAPLSLGERLQVAVWQYRGRPHNLRGVALYRELLKVLPGGRPTHPEQLRALWRLVWAPNDPDVAGALEIARDCPPRLVVDAGLHLSLIHQMTKASEINDARIDLAQELLRHEAYDMNSIERAVAELLVDGRAATERTLRGHDAAERVRQLLGQRDIAISRELHDWAKHKLDSTW